MSAGKITLKLVKGKNYSIPTLSDTILHRGDTVDVDAATAKLLKADGYTDGSNNFHAYFEEVAPPDTAAADDEDDDEVEGAGGSDGAEADADEAAKAEAKEAKAAARRTRATK